MFLIIGLPLSSLNVESLTIFDEENVGEAVVVNVAGYEPMTISSDYLQTKDFPVYVHLTGTTMGNFLFGDSTDDENSLTSSPLYQGIKINKVIITPENSSNRYLSGTPIYVRPQGNEYVVSPDGSFDLGHAIVNLRRTKNEADLPENLDINMSARIYFDTESGFGGMFGVQDLILSSNSNEENWLSDVTSQSESKFWGGKGYVRVIEMKEDHIVVTIYDGAHKVIASNLKLERDKEAIGFSLPGSSSIFGDRARIELKELVNTQTSATLIIKKGVAEPYEISLFEGMRLFPGSEWTIKSILASENKIIIRDGNSNTRELFTVDSVDKYGSCEGVELLSDSVLDFSNSELEKIDAFSWYCTSINEFEESVSLLLSMQMNNSVKKDLINSYANIAIAYGNLGASQLQQEYLWKAEELKSGSQTSVSSMLNYMQQQNTYTLSLSGGVVGLQSITTSDEVRTVNIKIGSGDFVTLHEGDTFGNQISDGIKTYKWMISSISEHRVVVVKKYDDSTTSGAKGIIEGRNELDGQSTYVQDIDTHRSAIVSLLPGSGRAFSESNFMIHLPIEKRAIQWTPEEIDNKIESTTKNIEKIDNVVDKLGSLIKGWKVACMSTFAILVVKNSFFQSPDARRLVMRSWTETCKKQVEDGNFDNIEKCYDQNKDLIEQQVDDSEVAVDKVKDVMKSFEGFDKQASRKLISDSINNGLTENELELLNKYGDFSAEDARDLVYMYEFNQTIFIDKLNGNDGLKTNSNLYSSIETGANSINSEIEKEAYVYSRLHQTSSVININSIGQSSDELAKEYLTDNYGTTKLNTATPIDDLINDGTLNFYGYTNGVKKSDLHRVVNDDNNPVLIAGKSIYADSSDNLYLINRDPNTLDNDYNKKFIVTPQIQYNQQHKPFIIPLTLRAGIFENSDYANYLLVDYDSSGNPTSYNVWNVGRDGKIDAFKSNTKNLDDVLVVHNSVLNMNQRAFSEILKKYNVANVKVSEGQKVPGTNYVASFAVSKLQSSATQCMDFMSKDDCDLLFGVCDPVMCPTSRFNFGGEWPVSNVVQTGIVGSLFLGLPNFGPKEPLPICLTGIHAGLQNIKSLLQGYNECLNTAKVSGESVGICNTIRSVYVCELMWREALAFFNVHGKVMSFISNKLFGKSTGGGEYLSWKSSWGNLQDSVSFFTKDYATSAFSSYTSRSTEELGTEVCKAAIFAKTPGIGEFFSQLTEIESPVQFTAWFDELEYTSSPTIGSDSLQSIYRVYYHIYAGESQDVRYSVYLKGPNKYNFYVTNPDGIQTRLFIEKGSYADESYTVTGDSGYNEICVEYNGITSCGFGKSTSEFSLNYLNDKIIKDEISRDINSAVDCAPDSPRVSPSLGGIIAPANYGLLNTGLIRVCSVVDPGNGMGSGQWEIVGNCGSDSEGRSLGYCWLDTETFQLNNIKDRKDIIDDISDDYIEGAQDDILNSSDADAMLDTIYSTAMTSGKFRLTSTEIKQIRDIIYYNHDPFVNARAHRFIGHTYHGFAIELNKFISMTNSKNSNCIIKYDFDWSVGMILAEYKPISFKYDTNWQWSWKNLFNKATPNIVSKCSMQPGVNNPNRWYSVQGDQIIKCYGDNYHLSTTPSADNGGDDVRFLYSSIFSELSKNDFKTGLNSLVTFAKSGKGDDDELHVYIGKDKKGTIKHNQIKNNPNAAIQKIINWCS